MPDIAFRALTEDDLPLLQRWLNNPDVAAFYGLSADGVQVRNPTLEQVSAQYSPRILKEEPTLAYITLLKGEPIGYIQSYRIGDYAGYAAALDVDDDDIGIDLLIGEDAQRNRGLGATVLRRFLADEVFQRLAAQRAIIAPNPENARAIGCYEKAGFHYVKTVFVPHDNMNEYVMAITRAEFDGGT